MASAASGAPAAVAAVVKKLDPVDVDVISCHAVTADEKLIAICPNNEQVLLFEASGPTGFQLKQVLSQHTLRVTGLAWSPTCTGKYPSLVSCSEDRTAAVWDFDEDTSTWTSTTVELAASRAALCAAWSPDSSRIAIGLASKDVAICYFEADERVRCWIAKKVGDHKSIKASVVSVAWHPTADFLAVGSADSNCTIFNVSQECMLPEPRPPFGNIEHQESAGSWVNAVAFGPSATKLALFPHDSSVLIKDLAAQDEPLLRLEWTGLPFLRGMFLREDCLLACGFDFVPVLFQHSKEKWECRGSVDCPTPAASTAGASENDAAAARAAAKAAFTTFTEARQRFGNTGGGGGGGAGGGGAPGGTAGGGRSKEGPTTSHTSVINGCQLLPGEGPGTGLPRFSTCGEDGKVLIWQFQTM
mmetsp:Transcript_83542/g.174768  ORF Transcript_83542/g.174768 Transcript_83542/m.174768 type:complete len:415 (-) Transcript_83542:84-1328(-)|eukprot:CAMPEP_0206502448 /NCGR_PEP_ID=MMETSP0324_2-20121206/54005_1 /ASSEMBLY_ACC=CAM_ASM_000836 /TAXON_ID=2866 /ORGANISM="Crypthecodinium cohnii, Strain Seligo" /LENGTH=414 /DNA_ID=CAMNT_0053990647 /DNA_START=118 /DNA_END=1362 /DNA_ORIENTATION=-